MSQPSTCSPGSSLLWSLAQQQGPKNKLQSPMRCWIVPRIAALARSQQYRGLRPGTSGPLLALPGGGSCQCIMAATSSAPNLGSEAGGSHVPAEPSRKEQGLRQQVKSPTCFIGLKVSRHDKHRRWGGGCRRRAELARGESAGTRPASVSASRGSPRPAGPGAPSSPVDHAHPAPWRLPPSCGCGQCRHLVEAPVADAHKAAADASYSVLHPGPRAPLQGVSRPRCAWLGAGCSPVCGEAAGRLGTRELVAPQE